ncbi:MAG: hypothetical protein IKH38_02005 [Clostridia bacterium]|nr:hypothetical protein [Clostridia bacterium]
MRRWICWAALLCLLAGCLPARAETGLADRGMDLGENAVHWPTLEGLPDAEIQENINRLLQERAQASQLTYALPQAMAAGKALRAEWSAEMEGDILSCVFRAEGIPTGAAFRWGSLCVDLETGEEIPLDALFTDGERARTVLEDWLADDLEPELSAHLMNHALTPLPDCFGLTRTGLTLYYPLDRFSTLHGQAGAVSFTWKELEPWTDLTEDSVLARFGVPETLEGNAEALREAAAAGALPGIPAELGEKLEPLAERYGLQADPDLYENGRYVQLEDSRFRGVLLMTDRLSEKDLAGSLVSGIRADRFGLWGLFTGETEQAEWRELLGEPDVSLTLDAEQAEALRLPPGTSDYYVCGENRLRLHGNEDGLLCAVFLLP